MKFLVLTCIVVFGVFSIEARSKRQAKSCTGLENRAGICIELKQCDLYREKVMADPRNAALLRSIMDASKECDFKSSAVCCPLGNENTENKEVISLPTFEDGCGTIGSGGYFRRIIGGEPPVLGTWPWIALLTYSTPNSDGLEFKCGGSIITKRHVLTAAHCLTPLLESVRLGEHDLRTDEETQHIDIKIKKTFKHPSYKRALKLYDVAVLYLEDDIPFSTLIKPICLPYNEELQSMNYVGWMPLAAGWGHTENGTISPIILQVQIEVYENDNCTDAYRKAQGIFEDESIDNTFICAGDITGNRDVCFGDSGGPLVLQHKTKNIVLIGTVTGGIGCGMKGLPSLFTRTAQYVDWIKETVAEIP